MFDPQMMLLTTVIAETVAALEEGTGSAVVWNTAREALAASGGGEPELAAALEARDGAALAALLGEWTTGKRTLPEHDRAVLKRAMKAYRKSFKVTRLDAESTIGGGPMSSGRQSGIVAITPPPRYPPAVWQELARQGRLIDAGQGLYELPPE